MPVGRQEKKQNKTLIIVGVAVVAVLGLGFVIAKVIGKTIKNKLTDTFLSRMLSKGSNGAVNVEGGGKKVTYSGEGGEFSLDLQTDKLPEGFPADFPVYPGAKLTSTWSAKDNNGQGTSVVWESSDTVGKISEFYKTDLEAKGWKVNATFTQTDSATYSFEKDKFNGFVGITKKDDKSVISVTLGEKEE